MIKLRGRVTRADTRWVELKGFSGYWNLSVDVETLSGTYTLSFDGNSFNAAHQVSHKYRSSGSKSEFQIICEQLKPGVWIEFDWISPSYKKSQKCHYYGYWGREWRLFKPAGYRLLGPSESHFAKPLHEEQQEKVHNSFFTKIVGVSKTQKIIEDLKKQDKLKEGTELDLSLDTTPEYGEEYEVGVYYVGDYYEDEEEEYEAYYYGDSDHKVKLGTLKSEIADDIGEKMDEGNEYKAIVTAVTGGDGKYYGVNIKIVEYSMETTWKQY